jgi:hypothetical protein
MEFRKLLCLKCKKKIQKAEAIYKQRRRLEIKLKAEQVQGKIKINKKK